MHRDGITDIDGAIVKLSEMAPELQVEALGNTHDEIINEAHRLLELPLAKGFIDDFVVHADRACDGSSEDWRRC